MHCTNGDVERIRKHAEQSGMSLSTLVMNCVHVHLFSMESRRERAQSLERLLETSARLARTRRVTHGDFLAMACAAYEKLMAPTTPPARRPERTPKRRRRHQKK